MEHERAGTSARALFSGLHAAVSAGCFTAASVLAVLAEIAGTPPLSQVAALLLALFVLLELRRIARPQMIAAGLLFAIALALSWDEDLPGLLMLGLVRTLPFLLIFASVGWLRAGALQSPAVGRLRDRLAELGEGRRFGALIVTSNLVGAGFNLAGIGLLTPMLDATRSDPRVGRRLRCAILWGFAATPCWSPFIVGTAAILAVFPGLEWTRVLPYGLGFAACFILWGMIYDRVVQRRGQVRFGAQSTGTGFRALLESGARLLVALTVLFMLTLGLMDWAGLRLTVAIALSAPIFALGWAALVQRGKGKPLIGMARQVVTGYPGMRTEATLFTAANVFGVAISSFLARHGVPGVVAGDMTGIFGVNLWLIILGYLAVSAIGIHPIISLTVFTAVVDPATLGMPIPLLAALMMTLWGMGTSVSPLSGTTLLMSQLAQVSSFTIAWRWSGLFYLLSTVWLACLVTAIR